MERRAYMNYTKEFREEVVKYWRESKQSYEAVGRKYGISGKAVSNWVNGRKPRRSKTLRSREEKKEIVKYHLSGATMKEVKEKYGIREQTLEIWESSLLEEVMEELKEEKEQEKTENQPEQKTLKWVRAGAGSGYWK